jgi:hypothetical protein
MAKREVWWGRGTATFPHFDMVNYRGTFLQFLAIMFLAV